MLVGAAEAAGAARAAEEGSLALSTYKFYGLPSKGALVYFSLQRKVDYNFMVTLPLVAPPILNCR